jgi:PhzF family phenazine biosynthesis protein
MPQAFHLVDAFTSCPFAGNPAAVYVLESWPAVDWLQLVAREMNQSETAYLVKNAAGYDLRWFTPQVEVDLCGHATLASAHTLWETGQANPSSPIAFSTRSGILTAARRGDLIELDFPLLRESPTAEPAGLADALGLRPRYVGQSQHDLLVEADSEATLRALQPDMTSLARVARRGVIVTAPSSDPSFDFVSRFFAPAAGIPEDPATGSAHCVLADFWHKRLGKTEFAAFQASARTGVLRVRVAGDRAVLGGQAVTVARGQLA